MTDAILVITDGTTRIDLINPSSGFHLVSWIPQITDYKGSGVFQNPPLADWRQLRSANWATAEENFGLHVNGANPNGVAYLLQQLRQLIEKANQYWTTDWQNDPVWLEVRTKCETNTRYCLVVKGRLGNDRNYYQQPFTGQVATMQDLPLVIERRAWLANAPGTGADLAISALEAYNGISYGNVDSSEVREPTSADNSVFIASKRNIANITNMHIGTAGGNLIGAALPFDIFSGTTPTYFGIDTSLSNSGPFNSIVFDLIAGAGSPAVTWQYWNGAWTTLVVAGTINGVTDGIKTIVFKQESDWVTTSPGGGLPTGYWVRATPAVAFSSEPQQRNRNVYSIVWPYVEIQDDAILGDIPALSRIIITAKGDQLGLGPRGSSNRMFIGLRSLSRGSNFTAYINCANEQNPTGISVQLPLGSQSSFVTDSTSLPQSSSGVSILYNPTDVSTAERVSIFFASSIAQDFHGEFRAFLRVTLSGSAGVISAFLRFSNNGDSSQTTDTVIVNDDTILDMGTLKIPGFISDESIGSFSINIGLSNNDAGLGTDLYLHDLILIPVDEWSIDTQDPVNSTSTSRISQGYLDIQGSIINPKSPHAFLRNNLSDDLVMSWQSRTNGTPILQANSRQRLWFLSMKKPTLASDDLDSPISGVFSISIKQNQRYLSLRGEQ